MSKIFFSYRNGELSWLGEDGARRYRKVTRDARAQAESEIQLYRDEVSEMIVRHKLSNRDKLRVFAWRVFAQRTTGMMI